MKVMEDVEKMLLTLYENLFSTSLEESAATAVSLIEVPRVAA